MKKTVLFAAALFAVTAANAQTGEITSNRGENWLSQDGDWGLTFEATPLLNYAGNLFNGTSGNGGAALNNLNTGIFSGNSGVVIGGKKLVDANTAYRAKLRIGFGSTKNTDLVAANPQPTPVPNPIATVEDVEKNSYMNIAIGAGIEKRVGSTRVVGIYGAEVMVGFGNSKTTNEYGNALTATNAGPRQTEQKNGSTFGIGLNGFAGVEWFCAPKISLSGEYTWGLAMTSTGTSETTTERFDTAANAIVSTTTEGDGGLQGTDKTSNFSIDTGVSGARIGINFYFQ
ncbi:MAG TPA: hypothetical protein VGE21_15120 [Flavobacteriales bacterium]